jgi:hypothetical protein
VKRGACTPFRFHRDESFAARETTVSSGWCGLYGLTGPGVTRNISRLRWRACRGLETGV